MCHVLRQVVDDQVGLAREVKVTIGVAIATRVVVVVVASVAQRVAAAAATDRRFVFNHQVGIGAAVEVLIHEFHAIVVGVIADVVVVVVVIVLADWACACGRIAFVDRR